MNRLQAIRQLKYQSHMSFSNGDGTYLVLFYVKEEVEYDDVWEAGVWCINSSVPKEGSSDKKDWRRLTWQEVHTLFRQAYPRRTTGQCDYVHECGTDCLCLHMKGDHNHCKKCGAATCMVHLCFTCETQANEMSVKITRQMAEYKNTFGIPFKKDEELYDHLTGAYDDYDDYIPRLRGDREDFHADG